MKWYSPQKSWVIRHGTAAIIVALAAALRYALGPLLGNQAPYITVCPAILVVAVTLGMGPGIFAAIIGAALTETYMVDAPTTVRLTAHAYLRMTVISLIALYLGHLGQLLLEARTRWKEQTQIARTAQEELKISRQRLAEWMDSIPQLAWRALSGGKVEWNQRWNHYTGQTPQQAGSHGWADAIHPDDLPRFTQRFHDNDERAGFYQVEYRIRGREGKYRWHLSGAMPVKDDAGHVLYWFGTAIDIEDHKRAERADADATSAKERFLAVLSHELRTPLTPVLTATEVVLQDPHLTPTIRDAATIIQRNIQIEARLIDDLLDVTRFAQDRLDLQMESVSIHSRINQVARISAAEVQQKDLHLTLELGASRDSVRADTERLQQIIRNLLRNAIKFTPAHGKITIRTRTDEGNIIIEMIDSGIGIDPEILPKLFQPFEQGTASVSRMFGGLGLGLAFCRVMVERHGGTLSASSPGRGLGATFFVRLPLIIGDAKPQPAEPGRTRHTIEEAARFRVLFVEDHADTARMTALVLRRAGYNVRVAESVATALAAAQEQDFDILVCDLGLPDGSGLAIMRALAPRGVKGIALTGFGQEVDVRNSHDAGFAEHLTKPVSIDELLETIGWLTPTSLVPDWFDKAKPA